MKEGGGVSSGGGGGGGKELEKVRVVHVHSKVMHHRFGE